jgi:hypothetical protein
MINKSAIHGQCFELYSPDDGHILVKQSTIDGCLWPKEDDVALGVTEKV